MKMQCLLAFITLCVIVLIGILSIPFLPSIEAALTLSSHQSSMGAASIPVNTATQRPDGNNGNNGNTQTPVMLAQDTFQRNDGMFWGTASDGQTWQGDANTNPAFIIRNHAGRIVQGHGLYNAVLGPTVTDAEVLSSGSVSRFMGLANIGAVVRWKDANNWYKAYIEGTQFILLKDVAGNMVKLAATPFKARPNEGYSIRFRVVGQQLMAKVWSVNQPEPQKWMLQATDNSIDAGQGGVRLFLQNGSAATVASFTETSVKNQ